MKEKKIVIDSRRRNIRRLSFLASLTFVLLIVSTYAWFTTNKTVSVTNLKGTLEVADSMEISLDGENWSQKIDLSDTNLVNDGYSNNNNRVPNELLPVSTDGLLTSDSEKIAFYRGKYTVSKGLTDIVQCDETETDKNDEEYPTFFAFDVFIRNLSKDKNNPDILQLNSNSYATVLTNQYIKIYRGDTATLASNLTYTQINQLMNTANDVRIYEGDSSSGLQNTIRVGFALFNETTDAISDAQKVLDDTVNRTGLSRNKISSVSIWEPNSDDHIDYIVTNNNKVTGYSAAVNFGKTSQFYTYALTSGAVGQTIKKPYEWYALGSTPPSGNLLFFQNTVQTTNKKNGGVVDDYTISEGVTNLTKTWKKNGSLYQFSTAQEDANYFKLKQNAISRMRIYVWLEGQDVDCVNYASYGGGIELRIGLTKGETVGDTKYDDEEATDDDEGASIIYEFLDNSDNPTYNLNSGIPTKVRVEADYSKFINGGTVSVDDDLLTADLDYTSKSGSTIIELQPDYLNSLEEGDHSLKINFNDGGKATTSLRIAVAETNPEDQDQEQEDQQQQEEQSEQGQQEDQQQQEEQSEQGQQENQQQQEEQSEQGQQEGQGQEDKATSNTETSYSFIENTANPTYKLKSSTDVVVRIDAEYNDKFKTGGSITIDDSIVATSNYEAKHGSTIITLKSSYLDTLSEGDHTLKVKFNDNKEVSTTLKIAAADSTSSENDEETSSKKDETTSTSTETKKSETTTTTNTTNTTTTTTTPKTGDDIVYVIALFVISVVTFVIYSKRRKDNE